MSLRRGLRRYVGTRKSAEAPWVMSGRTVYGMDNLDQTALSRETAMKISTVNRCVEVLSTSMAVLPLYIVNEHTHQRVHNHKLGEMLWDRPCPDMTPFDYGRLMAVNELLHGNAYAWIVRNRGSGAPEERIPLDPTRVTVVQETTGRVWYRYADPLSGDLYRIDREDMLHYKGYSVDGLEGISVLRRAAVTLETSQAADRYERAIYRNGGQPSGVLTTETDLNGKTVPIKDAAGNVVARIPGKDHIRNEWEKIHRGPDNAMRLAVLDNGLKYQPISMSGADLQFVENKDVRVADICRFFGVPLHLVYAGKQSYASNEQNSIEYVNYTLLGYERQWDQEDSYKLLLPSERQKGERVKRELKVFLQGDTAAQANWMRTMREIGAYNADEIRALDDRPPVSGGEEYYSSLNYVPQSEWKELARARAGTEKQWRAKHERRKEKHRHQGADPGRGGHGGRQFHQPAAAECGGSVSLPAGGLRQPGGPGPGAVFRRGSGTAGGALPRKAGAAGPQLVGGVPDGAGVQGPGGEPPDGAGAAQADSAVLHPPAVHHPGRSGGH